MKGIVSCLYATPAIFDMGFKHIDSYNVSANDVDLFGYPDKVVEYTYENCYISTFKEHEWFMNKFEYEITFVQETASA